jgi:hypothetical protein
VAIHTIRLILVRVRVRFASIRSLFDIFFWDGSPIRQTKAFDFDTQEKSVQHLGAMGWHGMGFITAFEHL